MNALTGAETTREKYERRYLQMRAIARNFGYALAKHGSEQRDYDLIAVPWTDEARDAKALIVVLAEAAEGVVTKGPIEKPHGRRSWVIQIGGGLYFDVSVMPRIE